MYELCTHSHTALTECGISPKATNINQITNINKAEKFIIDNHNDLTHKILHANISAGSGETISHSLFDFKSEHKMGSKMLGQT
jgi:hypothetical protein